MKEMPIAKAKRISKDKNYDAEPMRQRILQLLEQHNESFRGAALDSGLDHQGIRRVLSGQKPSIISLILLADHFGINPNELLLLAGWPRLKALDIETQSAENLPVEAVDVALALSRITEPKKRKDTARAFLTLLQNLG